MVTCGVCKSKDTFLIKTSGTISTYRCKQCGATITTDSARTPVQAVKPPAPAKKAEPVKKAAAPKKKGLYD